MAKQQQKTPEDLASNQRLIAQLEDEMRAQGLDPNEEVRRWNATKAVLKKAGQYVPTGDDPIEKYEEVHEWLWKQKHGEQTKGELAYLFRSQGMSWPQIEDQGIKSAVNSAKAYAKAVGAAWPIVPKEPS